jgi:hypothetical protein
MVFAVLSLVFVIDSQAAGTGEPPSNETSLGVVLTGGNTHTTTISISQINRHRNDANRFATKLDYLRSSNRGVEQALIWDAGFRYEREISPEWNALFGETLASNLYQGVIQRYSTDAGASYFIRKKETLRWFTEAGYRFNIENYSYGTTNLNFIRLYHEIEQKIDTSFSAKWGLEFLPELGDASRYQANSEISLAMSLTELFSVKSTYWIRYNHRPPEGVVNTTDQTFTTALVARF